MIDLKHEELLTFSEASQRLPKRPHLATWYRWISRGVRGVRLESVRVGGTSYTSAEALQRFADRLTGGDNVQVSVTSRQRQRQIEAADAELARAGI